MRTLPTKVELKAEQDKIKKMKAFNISYFLGKSHFEEDGAQNYSVIQPMYRYFKKIIGVGIGDYIYFWKSKGFSDGSINSPITSDYSLTPILRYFGTKTRVEFNGSCLKQDKITFTHGKIVNIYIGYEINKNLPIRNYPALENCLFGAVKLTKNNDIDKYNPAGMDASQMHF